MSLPGEFKFDLLTLETVRIQKVLTLLMTLDPALSTPNALASNSPEEPFAFVTVGGRGGTPENKVMRRSTGDRVDEGLERLLVNVHFLWRMEKVEQIV